MTTFLGQFVAHCITSPVMSRRHARTQRARCGVVITVSLPEIYARLALLCCGWDFELSCLPAWGWLLAGYHSTV